MSKKAKVCYLKSENGDIISPITSAEAVKIFINN